MADLETSVVISAETDDLRSGMEQASGSVQSATDSMRAQFVELGVAAEKAQSQIGAAFAQVGTTIGALRAKVASSTSSLSDGLIPSGAIADLRNMGGEPRRRRSP